MSSNCISCGMPMVEDKDFAMSDSTKLYCVHCSDEEGNLRSYEDVLENWSNFLVNIEKMEKEQALIMVKEQMEKLPAWQK